MSSARKPRLVIDARMAGALGHGIGLYVQQLAQGLAERELPYEPFYLIPPTCPRDSVLRRLPHAESKIPFLQKKELLLLGRELRRFAPALYHTPSFSSLFRYPAPYVQTVHDLNHLHFGSAAQKAYYRFLLLRSLNNARAVCSVSEASAAELQGWLRHHGVEKKVHVAPNAILEFAQADDAAVLRRLGLESGNYFFALANAKPHKNLAMLERAYAAARASRPLPSLVLSVPGSSRDGLVYTGALQDFEVGALHRHARACFSPSKYEGFGRPPVEAALAGSRPVVSAIPVHREALAGVEEAAFLDPLSEPAWQEAFLRVAAEPRASISTRSKQWIQETWSVARLAETMDGVYRACLGL